MPNITASILEERLHAAHADLRAALEQLPAAAWEQPRAVGPWSAAHWTAFLTAWLHEVGQGLREIQRRKKPTRLLRLLQDAEPLHAAVQQAAPSAVEPDRLLRDLEDACYQVAERIKPFSARDLNAPHRIDWLEHRPLAELIARLTTEQLSVGQAALRAAAERNAHVVS